jgi:hypothetical protein
MTRYSTAFAFALLVSARADVLTLRNGTKVTGSWLGGDSGQIRFLVKDQIRTYPRPDVSEVNFGPEPPSPSAKAIDEGPLSGDKANKAGTGDSSQKQIAPVADRVTLPSIKIGQTVDEVEAVLGKPTQLFDNLPGRKKIYIYKDPPVKITFQEGKLVDTE